MSISLDEDEVIHQLYQASAGLLPWPKALATLGAATNAMVSQFLTIELSTGRLVVCEQPANTVVDAALDYVRDYHRCDPHAAHIATMPVGALLNTETTFPRALMRSHRFYRDFWQPNAVRGLLASKVEDADGRLSIVSVVRSLDQPSFDRQEEQQAARFFRHLANAMLITRHNLRLRLAGHVGMQLMEASVRPMFLLGAGRRLLSVNSAGSACLEQGQVLKELGGVLSGLNDGTARVLSREFDYVWNSKDSDGRRAFRLPGNASGGTLCLLWNLSPESSMGAFGSERSVLLRLADSRVSGPVDTTFLAAILDLTPAEARVAWLIAFGSSLSDISAKLNVSLHTVRTQLKAVFAKTGCQRQVELTNLVNDLRL